MTWTVNPYTPGEAVGTVYSDGERVSVLESALTHPTHADGLVDKNDPVYCGDIVGIALGSAKAATDYIAVLTEGVLSLDVIAATAAGVNANIAIGDTLYIQSDGSVRPDPTGRALGISLNVLSGSTTATPIAVLVTKGLSRAALLLSNMATQAVTASGAANTEGITTLNSAAGALAVTLGDGATVGQTKVLVMTDATNSSTVTIAKHETSSPEVATFDAVGETLVLLWNGAKWLTIKATATFV